MENKVYKGKDLMLKQDNAVVAGATSANLTVTAETLDITTKSSGDWSESAGGLKSFSIDSDVLFKLAADFSIIEKVGTVVAIELSLDTIVYQGNALINDIKINSNVKDVLSYSVSMTGTGPLTKKSASA